MAHIYINFYTDINDAGILNVYLEGPSYFSENLLTQAGGGLLEKNYYITLAPGSYTLRMSYSPRSGHESDYFYGNCDIEY
jgi:hypothetical protein